MPKFIIKITSSDKVLLNNDDICCYLADTFSAPDVLRQAKASDKLVLACGENYLNFCLEQDLDGVFTSEPVDEKFPKYIKQLRKQLGHKFLGISCASNRHEAMLASECEPDFVAFKTMGTQAESDVLDWYQELFLIESALSYTADIGDQFLTKTDFLIINSAEYKILVDKMKTLD